MAQSLLIGHDNFDWTKQYTKKIDPDEDNKKHVRKIFSKSSGIVTKGVFSSKLKYDIFMANHMQRQIAIAPVKIIEILFDKGNYSRKFEPYGESGRRRRDDKLVFYLNHKERELRGKLACDLPSLISKIVLYPITFDEAVIGKKGSDIVYELDIDSVEKKNLYSGEVKKRVGVEYDVKSPWAHGGKVVKVFSYQDALTYLTKELELRKI